jgi:hypothetical protein
MIGAIEYIFEQGAYQNMKGEVLSSHLKNISFSSEAAAAFTSA